MEIQGKVWGSTSKIFEENNVEVRRIVGIKGGKSSIHRHLAKLSMFFVEKGSIAIHIEKNDYKLVDRTVLIAGQSTTIKPHEFHHFEILEDDTICYEIYWVKLDGADIERRDCGSILETK